MIRFRPKGHTVEDELRDAKEFPTLRALCDHLMATTTKWPQRPAALEPMALHFALAIGAKRRKGETWAAPYEVSAPGRGIVGYTDGDPR
jgi:hypothetical protein